MSNSLIEKKRIIFIDNISSNFASTYSKKYPNAVFFTLEGDIYKDGLIYTRIKGVDPNHNTLEIADKTVRLIINENHLLEFTSASKWYWYVGPIIKNTISQGDIISDKNSNEYGWRLIDTYNIDLDNIESNPTYNPFIFDPNENITKETNKPIFYTIKHIFDNDYNNDLVNEPIITESNSVNKDLYIYLPTKLVENYNVGLYDSLNTTNFLEEGNIVESDNSESTKFNRIFNGIEYNCYKMTGKNYGLFDLCIYAKNVKNKI